MIKKVIIFLVLALSVFKAAACESTKPERSEYIVDVNRYSHPGESCTSYTVLFSKRTPKTPNNFLTGVRIGLVSESDKELFSSNLVLIEEAEDQFVASFCINELLVKASYIELIISLPQSLELGERGTIKVGGFACMERETIFIKNLHSYSK
ncbi:hypothetical protein P886_1987 [Alteromonadaceae bacterium 2753L.S.0a.02]|nr:hypothetical protein P886_1987 [Alteromonadaceae bacterium 2753L.S.0a.02]